MGYWGDLKDDDEGMAPSATPKHPNRAPAESSAPLRDLNMAVTASRYLDLELSARVILRTLPPGSLSAPPSAVAALQKKLVDLAQAIWTQGWDCREEQGALAGAFGHASRYNPYRLPPPERKCRSCGAMPLYTERGRCEDCGDCQACGDDDCHQCHDEIIADTVKGSEGIPGDAVATLPVFPEKEIPLEDVIGLAHKMRDSPIPNLEERVTFDPPAAAAWDAGYEAGLLAQSQKSRGRAKFKIFNPYRKR